MSAKKRPAPLDLRETFNAIKDLLAQIHARLSASTPEVVAGCGPSILVDLRALAGLAESFTEQRPRSKKGLKEMADELDREGTTLWNASAMVGRVSDGEADFKELYAIVRMTAFRLIQAGLEPKPSLDNLVSTLHLASKSGAALSDAGKHDLASSVLTSAAQFEEQLRRRADSNKDKTGDAAEPDVPGRSPATVLYLSARMEASWRAGNVPIAEFMLQRITESDAQHLAHLATSDLVALADKILSIGRSLFEAHSTRPDDARADPDHDNTKNTDRARSEENTARRAQTALPWLQKAFALMERVDDEAHRVGAIKRSILRLLSRAYYMSRTLDPENLARAEATIDELVVLIDSDPNGERVNEEYQQIRWTRVAVLKQRKAEDNTIRDALFSVIDHLSLTELDVKDILVELRTLGGKRALVTSVMQHLLMRTVAATPDPHAGSSLVAHVLLSLVFQCTKDEEPDRAKADLEQAFEEVIKAECDLPKTPAAACLTILWQCGERHYAVRRYAPACVFFLLGSHALFTRVLGTATEHKCFRKAALCHVQAKEFAQAIAIVRRCEGGAEDAKSAYILFLAAAEQGLEDEAARAVDRMVRAPDFDPRMARLATQLARNLKLRELLLHVLEVVLRTMRGRQGLDMGVEAITLSRCLIRIAIGLMAEPGANKPAFLETICRHFNSAKVIVEEAFIQNKQNLIAKDISWLWRTAHNLAAQLCSEKEIVPDHVVELFDVTRSLLEMYVEATVVEADEEIYFHIATSSFSGLSCRVFATREDIKECGMLEDKLRPVVAEIVACNTRLRSILSSGKLPTEANAARVNSFVHLCWVFEIEFLCMLKDWQRMGKAIEELAQIDRGSISTFEAIADILWAQEDCPYEVLYAGLEAILHACVQGGSITVEKISRWLRAICTMLLVRNHDTDRAKAVGYFDQAIAVMEAHMGDDENDYPVDESQWLLATAYNTGIDCMFVRYFDEAKRWLECATVICRCVPNGDVQAEKISATYGQLLAQYGQGL